MELYSQYTRVSTSAVVNKSGSHSLQSKQVVLVGFN